MAIKYRQTVLNELARHGVVPSDDTSPDLIHEFVNELYLYEIRALRRRLLDGLIPAYSYAREVEGLRSRYPVLSLPLRFWTED